MLVTNFKESCSQYDKFEIWDVENIDAFFKGNSVLKEIFKNDYKLSVEDLASNREAVEASDMDIMEKLLDQIGDKHFYIFTYHSKNHLELMQMQMENVMNFGMDIQHIENDHVYIFIMDKKKTSAAFQI